MDLGSLYTHFEVYRSIEDGKFDFFYQDPSKIQAECFNAFLPGQDIRNLDEKFGELIENHQIQWADCRYLSNTYNRICD